MFEDVKKEPEDILSGVDKGQPPPTLPVAPGTPPQVGAPAGEQPLISPPIAERLKGAELAEPKVFWKKFLIISGVIIVVVGGVAGYFILKNIAPQEEKAPAAPAAPAEQPAAAPTAPAVEPEITEEPAVPLAPVDTDEDGLTDAEESVLATNPNLADSDEDGLSDREEVKVYLTDPLDADTDKDSFLDGHEVKNGYDPKGPGKLFEVPAPAE